MQPEQLNMALSSEEACEHKKNGLLTFVNFVNALTSENANRSTIMTYFTFLFLFIEFSLRSSASEEALYLFQASYIKPKNDMFSRP